MKRNRLLLLVSILALLTAILAGTASADVAFTTSDYKDGTLGIIGKASGELAVTQKVVGFGADPVAFGYSFGNRLLAVNRSGTATTDDAIYIFDPANLSKPLFNTTWAGARNIYDAEYMFGYLYVICHNEGKIIKVETANFTKVGEYTFDNSHLSTGYTAKGVSLTQLDGVLYALFAVRDAQYPPNYRDSWLIRLDDTLTQIGQMTSLPENAHTVTVNNKQLYVASWGGDQSANASALKSKVQVINVTVMGATELLNGEEIDGAPIAAISFAPDGTAFIATHRSDSNYNTTAKIYRFSSGLDVNSKKHLKTLNGWMTTMVYDSVTACFWVASSSGSDGSDQLLAFNRSDGSLVKSFSSTQLGGPVYHVTAVSGSSSSSQIVDGDGNGGGGGCSTAPFTTIGLLLIGALFTTRRR